MIFLRNILKIISKKNLEGNRQSLTTSSFFSSELMRPVTEASSSLGFLLLRPAATRVKIRQIEAIAQSTLLKPIYSWISIPNAYNAFHIIKNSILKINNRNTRFIKVKPFQRIPTETIQLSTIKISQSQVFRPKHGLPTFNFHARTWDIFQTPLLNKRKNKKPCWIKSQILEWILQLIQYPPHKSDKNVFQEI